MRKEELCGLSWPDIHWDQKQICIERASEYVQTKGSCRDIYLPTCVFEILKDYKAWWDGQHEKYGTDWQGQKERLVV